MAPHKSRITKSVNTGSAQKTHSQFPLILPKHSLIHRELLEDHIILIDGFLTAEECNNFVQFVDSQELELTLPKRKGNAERVNYRISVHSIDMAQRLYELLSPHLPDFAYPPSARRRNGPAARPVHSFNSHMRMYKYTPGQHFGPHYDDSIRDPQTGAKSEWTLLVYITGAEDGVKGGETIFYKNSKGKRREAIVAPLTRGTVLLHRHGHECLLHEGSPVVDGIKYILRSDLMFMD